MQNLLPLVGSLVCGDAIGRVDRFPFHIRVEDETPIKQSFIPYTREERESIKTYIEGQVQLGVLREVKINEKMPTFISSVVLVREGQSGSAGKTYRLAPNFVEVNARIACPQIPIEDFQAVLDRL